MKAKLTKLIAEVKEVDEEKASEIFREIMNGRFATDIFEWNDPSSIDSMWTKDIDDGWMGGYNTRHDPVWCTGPV